MAGEGREGSHQVCTVGGSADDLSTGHVISMINTKGERSIIIRLLVQFSQRI